MCKRQEVYLSRNQMGQYGLFTNGFLVYRLDSSDEEAAQDAARRSKFTFITAAQRCARNDCPCQARAESSDNTCAHYPDYIGRWEEVA